MRHVRGTICTAKSDVIFATSMSAAKWLFSRTEDRPMQFSIPRTTLFRHLTAVAGAATRGGTMPILSNGMLTTDGQDIALVATDLEVEVRTRAPIGQCKTPGTVTVPARKLLDLIRSLPDSSAINSKLDGNKALVSSGRSRFTLATLPSTEFPSVSDIGAVAPIRIQSSALRRLVVRAAGSMGNNDARAFLNGVFLDVQGTQLRCVGTDGHRLTLAEATIDVAVATRYSAIIPRKGVAEIINLLPDDESVVTIEGATGHVRVTVGSTTVVTKLIAGQYPAYEAVIPVNSEGSVVCEARTLRDSIRRSALLANARHRGVRMAISPEAIKLRTEDDNGGAAQDEVEVSASFTSLEYAVNCEYMLNALEGIDTEHVRLSLRDASSSILISGIGDTSIQHVVMPLRL